MNLFHLSTLYYIHNKNVYLHVLYYKVIHVCNVQVVIYLISYNNFKRFKTYTVSILCTNEILMLNNKILVNFKIKVNFFKRDFYLHFVHEIISNFNIDQAQIVFTEV